MLRPSEEIRLTERCNRHRREFPCWLIECPDCEAETKEKARANYFTRLRQEGVVMASDFHYSEMQAKEEKKRGGCLYLVIGVLLLDVLGVWGWGYCLHLWRY